MSKYKAPPKTGVARAEGVQLSEAISEKCTPHRTNRERVLAMQHTESVGSAKRGNPTNWEKDEQIDGPVFPAGRQQRLPMATSKVQKVPKLIETLFVVGHHELEVRIAPSLNHSL